MSENMVIIEYSITRCNKGPVEATHSLFYNLFIKSIEEQ